MKKRFKSILYISYWGFDDGLTQSSVFPTLEVINQLQPTAAKYLVTVERNGRLHAPTEVHGFKHIPLYSKNIRFNILNKINDIRLFPKLLRQLADQLQVDFIIARCAPAGILAEKVSRKLNIAFMVESFEPHAEYMRESGVWKPFDLRYIYQKRSEKRQQQQAQFLITVSEQYKKHLVENGLPANKIEVLPCPVDLNQFKPKDGAAAQIRKELNIAPKTTVGIYVGKFGDIYLKEQAYELFKQAADCFKDFKLIVLSPQPKEEIEHGLTKAGLNANQFWINKVPHTQVPQYLQAADFGFCTVQPSKSRIYCSAIKVGEYMAMGLPVAITERCGDDTAIIEKHGFGIVITQPYHQLQNWKALIKATSKQPEIIAHAKANRGKDLIQKVYQNIFKTFN